MITRWCLVTRDVREEGETQWSTGTLEIIFKG